MLVKFRQNEHLASIYHAYHSLHRYLEEPFTSFMPEALFNIGRFLMTETHQNKPPGVSQLYHYQFNAYLAIIYLLTFSATFCIV